MNSSRHVSLRQSGFSMIEVLVTLVILLVGLLGLAGLMVQSQRAEMESYQRVQALVLLQDMYGRINANRRVAACYVTTALNPAYLGTNAAGTGPVAAPACAAGTAEQNTRATQDMNDWSGLLAGTAETSSGGSNVGAMVGGRGCLSYGGATTEVDQTDPYTGLSTGVKLPGTGIYTLSVAWQGMGETFAPVGLTCGQNLYPTAAQPDEKQRRVVSLTFRIAASS